MAHYVDNAAFTGAVIEYKEELKRNPEARVPKYIGDCVIDICENFSRRPNFCGYSWRDEMVGDAIINCFRKLDRFDPEKSMNAFSYFTQIAFFAFLNRIKLEKKESKARRKMAREFMHEAYENGEMDDHEISQNIVSALQMFADSDDEEDYKPKKKREKAPTLLETFLQEAE